MKKKVWSLIVMGVLVAGLTACSGGSQTDSHSVISLKTSGEKEVASTEEASTEEAYVPENSLEGYDHCGYAYFLSGDYEYETSSDVAGLGAMDVYSYVNGTEDFTDIETFGILSVSVESFREAVGASEITLSPEIITNALIASVKATYGEGYTESTVTGGINRNGEPINWSLYEYQGVNVNGYTANYRVYIYIDDTDIVMLQHAIPQMHEFTDHFDSVLNSIIITEASVAGGSSGDVSDEIHYLEDFNGNQVGIHELSGYTCSYASDYSVDYDSDTADVIVTYKLGYSSDFNESADSHVSFYTETMDYVVEADERGSFTNDVGQEISYQFLTVNTGGYTRYECIFWNEYQGSYIVTAEVTSYDTPINVEDYKYLMNSDICILP